MRRMVLAPLAAAALICLDPGHGTPPAIGAQTEPIGPGSHVRKIKDGGGTAGEAEVNLAIAKKTRTLLLRAGYRVAMTRTGPTFRYGSGGNVARAQFCNVRRAALMLRVHADGSADTRLHGALTLFPAFHRGWTDDIYARSLRAARLVQRAVVRATGAKDLGLVQRSDLTGFNWANVPAILVETGFLTNPTEHRRLESGAYQRRVARGLVAGVEAYVRPGRLRMRSAVRRPSAWTRLRRSSTSGAGSARSTGVSADSNSSRSSTIERASASLRRSSSARGSAGGSGGAGGASTEAARRLAATSR
jgi:N-acetylmuramoyl-L-alanine amidase